MSGTCPTLDAELLSAYLDHELEGCEADDVAFHLESCRHCRLQLDSLVRVAKALRSLERVAPPPILDELVLGRREVRGARSWFQRLDTLMSSSQRTRSTIGPIFALVMMLVLLVYLFSDALVKRNNRSVVISVPSSMASGFTKDPWANSTKVLPESGKKFSAVFGVEDEATESWTGFANRESVIRVWLEVEQDAPFTGELPAEAKAVGAHGPWCSAAEEGERSAFAGLLDGAGLLDSNATFAPGPVAVLVVLDGELVCRRFSSSEGTADGAP